MNLSVNFNGKEDEDEYLQIKKNISNGINVKKYPYFEIAFKLEYSSVQLIDVVLGVDIDGDCKIDSFIFRLYK